MKRWIGCLLLTGCMVGPNYKEPQNALSPNWTAVIAEDVISQENLLVEWWKLFCDPLLTQCIENAVRCNYDLNSACETILQAKALRQVKASSLFPQIIADINGTKTYFSKNGPVFAIGVPTASGAETETGSLSPATGLPFQVQVPQIQNLFNALFDATWEIDLFGKIRRGVEFASAIMDAAIAQRNDLLISIVAEVAKNYIELRTFQMGALFVEQTIDLLEQKREINEKNHLEGYSSTIAVESAASELNLAKAALPLLIAKSYRAIYAISLLTSQLPETLLPLLGEVKPLPAIPEKTAVGLRSDLLKRRPDIRVAERKLAAATANVGVAVASFFPSITIGGDGGFQSLSIRDLFQGKSKTWAIGGDINLPIFEGGRLIGNYRASKASLAEAACTYQQTILKALEEVEGNLVGYKQGLTVCNELQANLVHQQNIDFLTEQLYGQGIKTFLDLLSQKEQVIQSREVLLLSQSATLIDLIALYKSLGGGWEDSENLPA